ncbi:lysylphosphatidylglycerol synthase domain-containing protein [Phenylobacterium aquaticum]|uniref:lysylphosphatidylglycerol synthase domain-containing protein n=1 Tax=Phenylobacterium aquaticum TaxID=1763816 RepID=UPI0026F2F35F|nr:lysylphosphatidylglycerol synthase domain-containing protein [Phenylobacterium aquaticum]
MTRPPKALINAAISGLLLAAAAYVLWRELHHTSTAEIAAAARAWSPGRLAVAAALSLAGYLLLGINEQIALRWSGSNIGWIPGVGGSFVSHALANNLGMTIFVGGAIRAGVYARHGVTVAQSAVVTVYGAMSFGLGLAALSGLSFLLAPAAAFQTLGAPVGLMRVTGALLAAAPLAYLAACALIRRQVTLLGQQVALPPLWLGLVQFGFGLGDVVLSAALMWLLIPGHGLGFATFSGGYLTAMSAGLFSGVPGGLGVFEGALVALLPQLPRPALAAGMLGYRLFYYLLPLGISAVALAGDALMARRQAPPAAS